MAGEIEMGCTGRLPFGPAEPAIGAGRRSINTSGTMTTRQTMPIAA